jgi:hypothetical protein
MSRCSTTALDGGEDVSMSSTSYKIGRPDAGPESPHPATVMPKRTCSARTSSRASMPSGVRIAVTIADRSSSGENSSSPIAFAPSRHARPSAACRANAASRPSSRRRPRATSSAATIVTAGVNGVDPVSSDARMRSQSK